MLKQISIVGLLAASLAGPALAQDSTPKPDSMSHDAMKSNAMSAATPKHDAMTKSSHMTHGGMKNDTMGKEATPSDAMASDKMAPK